MVEVAVEAGWLAIDTSTPIEDQPTRYVGAAVFHPYGKDGCGEGPHDPHCHIDLEDGVSLPSDEVRYLHWRDTWHGGGLPGFEF